MVDISNVKVKSLQKSLEILNCFTEKQPLGVTEISEKLGLYKSNVHSILSTYKAMEYLEQDPETGKYRLGSGIFALCHAASDGLNIIKIAVPVMQELVKEVGEIVYLSVPHHDEVIYLEAIYPAESIRPMRSLLGDRTKMYCTGAGKAMMAQMTDELIEEYTSKELKKLTDYTITDKEVLKKELIKIKERGYAIDNMELEFGIKCVGVPILNRHGELEGALSVSGPSLRFDDENLVQLSEILKKYTKEIQKKL